MKNLFASVVLVLGVIAFSYAQNDIAFQMKSNNGKLFTEDNGTYSLSLVVLGLKSDKEVENFKSVITSNSIVKQFEISPAVAGSENHKANFILTSKEKEALISLFKSANVNQLIVDEKTYTLDQFDQMKADLKAK